MTPCKVKLVVRHSKATIPTKISKKASWPKQRAKKTKKAINKVTVKYWAYGVQATRIYRRHPLVLKIILGGKHVNTVVFERAWPSEREASPTIKIEPE